MSIRRGDLPFMLKIFSLLLILILVNIRNKMNIDFQLANQLEIKEYNITEAYSTTAQKFVKNNISKGIIWENIEVTK